MDTARPPARGRWVDRAFSRALAIAALLHFPLVPSRLFDWARLALFSHAGDYDDADASAIVPIDLDLLAKDPVAEPAPAEPAPSAAPPPAPGDTPVDAGAPKPRPDAGAPPSDGGAPAPAPSAAPRADAGPPEPAPVRDPLSAAGGAGKIAAKDPNVQLLLSGRAIRKHPLGPWFSRLLLMIPEWKNFFGDTPIDPVRDLDHLLITAPRLRGDTGKMVAIMATNVDHEVIREAVDQVIHRANGVWIEDAPVPAARAKIGGAPRVFAMVPQKKLLVVLPGDATDQLERLKQAKPFRNSSEAIVVSLLTPARPFREFFPLPDTLKWMRIAVIPTADGGVDLAIEAGDRSAEDAAEHAKKLTEEMERRRKIDVLGLTSVEILDAVTFVGAGDTIRARTHVSSGQVRQIMGYVEQRARERFGVGRTEH